MTNSPPKFAQKILLRFLRDDLAEEVLGDLEEKFFVTVKKRSPFRAKVNYWYQVLNYLRPFSIRKSKSVYINHIGMLNNYFKVGSRSMLRQKMFSSIKIGGFALGIAACLLIGLFIRQELSYDQHYPDKDRIYRVIRCDNGDRGFIRQVWMEAPFARALEESFPEVEKTGRLNPGALFGAGANQVRRADKVENFYEEGFAYADQSLLDIFDIQMVYGSASHALAEPNSIVISKSKAYKYFPNEDPVGKILVLNNNEDRSFTIGGVMEDLPGNSHLQFDFLMTMTEREFGRGEQNNWRATNYPTYVLLRRGADPGALEEKMLSLVKTHHLPDWINYGIVDAEKYVARLSFQLQPVADIHLRSGDIYDIVPRGDIKLIWLFGGVAAFILVIACINFINLSTARSANRAREVGMRKVVGSFRGQLVRQFLAESLLFSMLSFVIGVLLAVLFLPYFNELSGKSLVFPWHEWWLFPLLIAALFIVGILAGLYPSFYLSSFQPIQVLKGSLSKGSSNASLRSLLVVFQFTASIVLIIGTLVIYRQMNFILNTKLGFDKDQVLLIHGTNTLGNQVNTFKDELLEIPDVKSVSLTDYLPVSGTKRNGNGFWKAGEVQTEKPVFGQMWRVDHDYLKTMGMAVVEGRDFSVQIASDSQAMVINERMAHELFQGQALGRSIVNGGGPPWTIIGVVEDFHFESLKEDIRPLAMVIGTNSNITSVKVNTADMPSFLGSVENVWKKFLPHQPLRHTFMDESFARMYEDVQRMGRIFTTFAVLAIVVACLGLFALSAFMVEQRGREISIRLVLGASMKNVFRLLTQNFLMLVLISFVIAAPMAWYLMNRWLEGYKYKIDISWDVFAGAGLIAMAIALFTISYQAVHAAITNPVKNLRSE
jgi:putative ABC transport system permease protein